MQVSNDSIPPILTRIYNSGNTTLSRNEELNEMPSLLEELDPDGLLEYSVVYSDRSLNHMSQQFQAAMNNISASLKGVYNASAAVVVPGSGTYGMEAAARQFATGKKCLVIRNGWFSYRWSQIFEAGDIPSSEIVLKAKQIADETQAPFAPPAIDEVVASIQSEKPDVVFAPHVETSAGMILPDDYLTQVATAAHSVGAMFVLDCIASGAIWIDMKSIGIDALISAPQKGWSGSPCSGLVMLSDLGLERMEATKSSSFACDLKKWHSIMQAFEGGGHAYHCTMPTDALLKFNDVINEMKSLGFDELRQMQQTLGDRTREMLEEKGFCSVAANGFKAPGVVVSYTSDPQIKNGAKFRDAGVQIAGGVPLACDERQDFQTFRVGLFGLEKMQNIDRTVQSLASAVDTVLD